MKKSIHLGLALPLAAAAAFGQNTYQLEYSTSSGVDFTALSGYYADRMEGPTTSINFEGPLTGVDPSVSDSNPFRLIGRGGTINVVNSGSTGLHSTPLMLYNAEGVNGTSTLYYKKGAGCQIRDIGRGSKVKHEWLNNGHIYYFGNTLKVHDGGTIEDYHINLGYNAPISVSVTDGGSIAVKGSGYYIRLGVQAAEVDTPITAFMGITNATVTAGGTKPNDGECFALLYNVKGDAREARLVLGPDGVLSANSVSHHGGGRSFIQFDGGRYQSLRDLSGIPVFHLYGKTYDNNWPNPVMTVEGINGNPIDVEIAYTRNLSGGQTGSIRKINLTGDGGFTKRGAGTLVFNRHAPNSTCDYTGPTTILGGGIVVTNSVYKPGRGDLAVSDGAFLDLNGFDAEFAGATGAGIVTNGAATVSTLTLGYGDTNAAFTVAIGERINVVKTGTGMLTVSGAALAATCDLTVEAGTVVFAGDSSSYGTVRVKSGATFDSTGTHFSCTRLVREPGGTVLPPGATVVYIR